MADARGPVAAPSLVVQLPSKGLADVKLVLRVPSYREESGRLVFALFCAQLIREYYAYAPPFVCSIRVPELIAGVVVAIVSELGHAIASREAPKRYHLLEADARLRRGTSGHPQSLSRP